MRSLAPFTRPVNREVVSAAAAPLSRFLLSIIGFCPRKMVLKVKGKIAPFIITLLLPNTVDIFSDSDEIKRAVWQTEGVFQNSFTCRTTRDRSHGHLKSIAGTHQAAAQIYRRVARDDP